MEANLDNNLLTKLEKAGGSVVLPRSATREQRHALELHVAALKAQGHALSVDEVIEHGEVSGDVRVIHYRTCMACAGVKNAK